MSIKAFLFLTVSLLVSTADVYPAKADTNHLDIIKIGEIYELQIPNVQPHGVIDCIDWSDSNKILFNVTDHWEGKFSRIQVVDPDGCNLKRLISGNRKCTNARWIMGDKIAYIENNKLSIMDTDGHDVSDLLPAEVRNACTNPWLLSSRYGLIEDRGKEIVLFSGQNSEKRVTIAEHNTRWLRALANFPGLISDKGNFVLSQARVQYKTLLQRIDLKDGKVHDLALYRDPSTYCGRSFACSHDGTAILYITGCEIWAMSILGYNSHCVYPDANKSRQYGPIAFSPKDDKIVFSSRELKGDRKWRTWIATLQKDVRPAKIYDKLEAIIISETSSSHTINPGDVLSLKQELDPRISVREVNFDVDAGKELLVLLQRGKEKDVIVLDYQTKRYVPIWTKRCFYWSDIQTLDINETDKIKAIAIHTDNLRHGTKDDCRIYKLNNGTMEQIWHQVLTNIYNWGYKGKLTLNGGTDYKDIIATITIYYFKSSSRAGPIEPREEIELRYKWNGKQYVGDEIEQRVAPIMQKLKIE